jgi:sigma-B regulation protein RsbU (phosphoserine phosphatase)
VTSTVRDRTARQAGTDFKALYRRLERTLDRIERIESTQELLGEVLTLLVRDFRDDLGFQGGRMYQREGDEFVLCCRAGEGNQAPLGYRIPLTYSPIGRCLAEGLIIMRAGDPGFDERVEGPVGVDKFAAIALGAESGHIMAFTIEGEIKEEHTLYSLNAVRHVINLKLRQQHLAGIMEESRVIQESLLPSSPPAFAGYDIDGRSRAAEIVGGDAFDYLSLSRTLLGVAIADASGHGLPAALLARDVITGLRVGMAEDLKIIKAVERLNRVIHRSALSSKFVSLFYGELEPSGNFIYCNAGHNPPLVWSGDGFRELTHGGLVLGPNPDAHYERGYVNLVPGDAVVLYTDGVTEREDPSGALFGRQRLRRLLRGLDGASARQVVDAVFEAADAFAKGAPQRDDMTVVVVRKL